MELLLFSVKIAVKNLVVQDFFNNGELLRIERALLSSKLERLHSHI